ncbi:ORF6N domain-containing protein [Bacillus massiliigorillae]|uniref:ORF6N domain-containing protein n=1 Tax=Bacillus massiliigorillae TaxID=1243664 RepID=UPI00039F6E55|nr:ORF6N domain-containing protein [Bacillus massiliigorillae]
MNQLKVIEKNGQRVLLTSQLAESYATDTKTINRNFQRNTDRYVHGKHYFALTGEDLKAFKGSRQIDATLKYSSVLYLWTEKGAFLHAKSLNTDAAWEVYAKLVDSYFNKVKVLTEHEQRVELLQLSLEHDKKLLEFDQRLIEVENNVIKKQIGSRVYKVYEDYNPNAIGKNLLFPKIHRNFRDAFAIPTYRDLRKIDFDEALAWIKSWRPLV